MWETTTYRMLTYRSSQPRPNPRAGLLVGFMLTAALTALFYGARRIVHLPFAAFDFFDRSIQSFGSGETPLSAGVIGPTVAIVGMAIGGTAIGGLLFVVFRRCRSRFSMILGALAGVATGAIAAFVNQNANQSASRLGPLVWIVGGFVLWGLALGWSYRQQRLSLLRDDADGGRRFMLKLAGVTALVTIAGASCGKLFATEGFTRSTAAEQPPSWSPPLTIANDTEPASPVRVETPPRDERNQININMISSPTLQDWRLEIVGMVQRPKLITLKQLRNDYPALDQMVTSSCTDPGGRPGAQRWTGVSLQRLLPALGAKPSATHLKIRSTSGFFEMVSMQAIRSDDRVMLTYAWDGAPLPDDRGFPLRIYIPNCSAMKRSNGAGSNGTSDRELGYWIERGWDDPLSINPERQVLGRKSASR